MVRRLKDCISQRNCPNFWIPKINLFEKLKEDDFWLLENMIILVEKNPKKYITDTWLEYSRFFRNNCCYYCGNGYYMNNGKGCGNCCQLDICYCYCCKCSSDRCWPCGSSKYQYDPLALDVY